jgi:hypothetical protein
VAALLTGKMDVRAMSVGVVPSGGNVECRCSPTSSAATLAEPAVSRRGRSV